MTRGDTALWRGGLLGLFKTSDGTPDAQRNLPILIVSQDSRSTRRTGRPAAGVFVRLVLPREKHRSNFCSPLLERVEEHSREEKEIRSRLGGRLME